MNGTNSTSYSYNSLHQLTKVTPPTGNSLQAENLTYDGFGRVATITDGAGNTLTYTYDNGRPDHQAGLHRRHRTR